MKRRDMNIPLHAMSKPALVEKCQDLSDELERVRGSLTDTMDRNSDLRFRNTKLVRVKKKRKGVVDERSKKFIRESALRSCLANLVALAITIPASLQDGSFTIYLLLNGVCSGILIPLQTYLQKRNEEI
tara:strand:+ start:123 stop:509 length:387 start_codon:yes stop_codon:yes gene_type:complete